MQESILSSAQRRLVTVVLAALFATAGLLVVKASAAEASCTGGAVCYWSGSGFTGTSEHDTHCETYFTGGWPMWFTAHSVKNHCSNVIEIGWFENGSTHWKACMNPGGERSNPGRVNEYRSRAFAHC